MPESITTNAASNERTIPSSQPRSVCTFTILSAGNEVSREYHVLSIVVNKEVNRIPSATIILLDGTPSEQTFNISNEDVFEPGKEIEIKAGHRSDEETIFKGVVVRHGIKVRKSGAVLVIECKDKAVKMTATPHSKYFSEVKDSDAIEELIDKHGVDKEVAATSVTHKQLVQYNATDWDFIMCRADVNGLLCIPNDGKIKIDKPSFSGDAALTIQYGATVHELDAEIDARLQFKSVKATSWDPANQELISGIEAADPGTPDAGNIDADTLASVVDEENYQLQYSGKVPDEELQQWADSMMMKHRLAKIRGSVKIDGTSAVIPGQLIQLNGAGERFEGKLFVTGVRQQIENGDWKTVLQFGLNPEWFAQTYNVQQPLAGALLPAIQGLHIGICTHLESDPDGEFRIKVRLPVIHAEEEGTWCRIATLDAGKNRGTFFRPEIGDEVIVGFLENDPRQGVVLGMCNSSKLPAPLEAKDDNHEKGYVSRSEMKMIYNDDKKTINIETPAGNKILLSEDEKKIQFEDQNGNKIVMDKDGITLESVKDIVLKAATDLKADAVNATIKGSAAAKMEGSGSAEFSSGGTAKVKGAIVQIN